MSRVARPLATPVVALVALAAVMVVVLAAAGCRSGSKAGPVPTSDPGPAATVPDPEGQPPGPPEAQLTLASTRLVLGRPATFGGTGCPAGNRGDLRIVSGVTGRVQPSSGPALGGAVAGDDNRWSFEATVADLPGGPAWATAVCTDPSGAVVFAYPRVPVQLVTG